MGGEDKPTFMQKVATNWAAFRLFLWNSEKKEFLGRNGKSWGQIGIFYLIFYTGLAAFWALMLFIFLQTVSSDDPTYNSYVSVPGLALTPKFDKRPVEFDPDNNKTYAEHVKRLNSIWDKNQVGSPYVDCSNDTAEDGEYCRFDREVFGPCRPPYFGWDEGKPCLLLSLNRVSRWKPTNYEDDEVPEEIEDDYVPGNVFLKCMNYKNKNQYSNNTIYPAYGIPEEYYPFIGTTNVTQRSQYIQPYVAVQFQFHKVDTKIKIQCNSFAGNIKPLGDVLDVNFIAQSQSFGQNTEFSAQVGLFYLIYYICLAGFWGLMLFIFMQTIDSDHPTYNSYVSRPGLAAVPHSPDKIIKFSAANNNDYAKYTKQLQVIWDSLDPANQTEGYVDCSNGTEPPQGSFCRFDRSSLGEFCVPPDFGYDQRKPCVFLSLNQVVDWEPEDYEANKIPKDIADSFKPGYIAFKCGSYKNKKPEQLGDATRIYPFYGIPYYYYPYVGTTNQTKQAMYKKPYVAVRFDLEAREEDIWVQCKTYTGSIEPLDGLYDTKFESQVSFVFHLTKEPTNLEL